MLWYVMAGSAIGGGARFLLRPWVQQRTGAAQALGEEVDLRRVERQVEVA